MSNWNHPPPNSQLSFRHHWNSLPFLSDFLKTSRLRNKILARSNIVKTWVSGKYLTNSGFDRYAVAFSMRPFFLSRPYFSKGDHKLPYQIILTLISGVSQASFMSSTETLAIAREPGHEKTFRHFMQFCEVLSTNTGYIAGNHRFRGINDLSILHHPCVFRANIEPRR